MGGGEDASPPLRISDSKQQESVVLQLCSIVLQFFQLYLSLFSITRMDGCRNCAPPLHCEFRIAFPPIANFLFETTEISCVPIVLNCAVIFLNCTRPFFQLLEGGGAGTQTPPLRISGSKQRESIVLQLCSTEPCTPHILGEFFGIVVNKKIGVSKRQKI